MSTVQTAIGRFVWHDHMSGDPQRAVSFYTDLLGWETEIWKPGEMDYPMIIANGKMHGGFGPAQGGAPSHWLGHISVENVDDACERAENAGGSVLAGPMDIPEVGRMAAIQDPQGAVFSVFSSASEESPLSEGVFVWDELHTSDVEGAKAFYAETIGWTSRDMDMGESGVYTILSSGETDRGGCMPTPPGVDAPPHWLTYLGTDDVDATAAKAEKLGGSTLMAPWDIPEVGRLAVLADSTGAVFGLYKPSEAAS